MEITVSVVAYSLIFFIVVQLQLSPFFPQCSHLPCPPAPQTPTQSSPMILYYSVFWLLSFSFTSAFPSSDCFLLIDFRERKRRGRHQFVVPLVYAFIGFFLYVPWLGIEPATLTYLDSTLTSWEMWPGPSVAVMSSLLVSLGHTGRRVVLDHTLNTQTLMKPDEQKRF